MKWAAGRASDLIMIPGVSLPGCWVDEGNVLQLGSHCLCFFCVDALPHENVVRGCKSCMNSFWWGSNINKRWTNQYKTSPALGIHIFPSLNYLEWAASWSYELTWIDFPNQMIVNIHPIPKALPYMEQMLPHSRHPLTNAQLRRCHCRGATWTRNGL